MEWQHEHEDLLRVWTTQAFYEKAMHGHAAVFYTKVYYWGGGFNVGLAAITSAGVFFQFSDLFGGQTWGFVVIALLSLASAVMAAAMQFLNPLSLATSHSRAENLYNSFIVDVNAVACCRRENREDCATFMTKARTQLQLLPLACPTIPTRISKLYIMRKPREPQRDDHLDLVIAATEDSGEKVMLQQQQDVEKSLEKEAAETGNSKLYEFIAEKSNILDASHQV